MQTFHSTVLAMVVGCCLVKPVDGALLSDPTLRATSVTRQFTVVASERAVPDLASQPVSRQLGLVQLTPAMAAVNCERVKDAFLRLLKQPDHWRGRITIAIQPASRGNLSVRIEPTLYADGWNYRVELPPELSPERFVAALTQTLLLELANRSGTARCAELPLWLAEGMTLEIMRSELNLLAERSTDLATGGARVGSGLPQVQMVVAPDPLAIPRRRFAGRPALTFDEMSWPTSEQLRGDNREVFRDSAQLLFHSLLSRNGGPASMTAFIERLSENLNWQTSFLNAFHRDFGRLIDVEKWWAVNVATFSGRNQWQMWSPVDAIAKLDQALRVEIEQPQGFGQLPKRELVSLQRLISDWDYSQQATAIASVVRQLAGIRMNCPPDLSQLVDDYRVALETYSNKRGGSPAAVIRGGLGSSSKLVIRAALERLNELDARREIWRREYDVATARTPQ